MNPNHITPEDFISDETFVAWFRQADKQHVQYWDDWLQQHPERKADVEAAVRLLTLLDMKETRPSQEHTLQARDRLMASIETTGRGVVHISRRKAIWWASAAAVAAVILIVSFLFRPNDTTLYITGFGETKTFTLPDGSTVTLNANSQLKLAGEWKTDAPREVWLMGEGFFSVKHTALHTKFMVHADEVNVEVLGTEFNVKQRREQTTVVLKSGKVQLTLNDEKDGKALVMAPGELVAYGSKSGEIARKKVNANTYAAWKEGKMIFENASIQEIAGILEETYGVTVDIEDPALKEKEFNGVFPTDNKSILLNALSKAYNLEIEQAGERINIRSRKGIAP